MESPNAPITTRPSQAIVANFPVVYSFLFFALFSGILATGAILGEHVDAVTWTVPKAIPMMTRILNWSLSRPAISEEARQQADISRWDV